MMPTWRVADLVDWAGGTLLRGDKWQDVRGVSTDSRTVQAGNVFVALRGEQFDGHGFLDDAVRRGAACVVVSDTSRLGATRPATDGADPGVIGVADTEKALQDLASAHRRNYQGSVVAITGSNGKTTVKEMTASVLQCWLSTHKTSGNLNNHIGVPLAVLSLELLKRVLVLELGMNHLGEISRLCEIARPHVGVITNIGQAHLGGLGSVASIQQAKGELTASLPSSGVAIVNADDPRTLALGRQSAARLLTFGQSQDADVRGWVRENLELDGTRCCVVLNGKTHSLRLRVPGTHQIMNALAAAAVGMTFGVPEERIVWALQRHRGVRGRLAVRRGREDVWLIDDTYNANPQSMRTALRFLAGVSGAGRRIAVLGDMLELGETGPALHEKIGSAVSNANIHVLIALGPNARYIAQGARQAGMECRRIHHAQSQQEVLDALDKIAQPRDVILFKGSRGMAMERLVEALTDDPGVA
ncbi:MAG: UDP-N-acetylmuramoyl-tripeptide--D-alanyl-D-alanine ligase [Candidatus Tectomicrobia bacterium]|nr:UDP-N-acetylmuramoyl-tripeptide--D-alanyl-D-alanine ligase [Candidatus Tectomicrobia bacterium]